MKRALIIALVVAVLAGIGYIGLSAQSTAADNDSRGASKDTVLVTIAEEVTLAGGGGPSTDFVADCIDVESYRHFKLYAVMKPGPLPPPTPIPPAPAVKVQIGDSPGEDGPNCAVATRNSL